MLHVCLQVLGDMIVYPNRMTFDIMPGGGKPPEPIGMLVVKVQNISDIHGGGDLFSKVTFFPFPSSIWQVGHNSGVSLLLSYQLIAIRLVAQLLFSQG